MSKLVAKRNELDAKRKALAEVFEAAGSDYDFTRQEVLDKLSASDSAEAVEKVRSLNREIEELYDAAKELADLEAIATSVDGVRKQPQGAGTPHADPTRPAPRLLGDLIVESETFEAFRKTGSAVKGEITNYGIREFRATLMETGAGWAPESVRSGRLVEAVTRPIQVLDIIPPGQTDQAAYLYMEETLRTHSAAETVEGGTYNESAFEWTERSEPVRKITDSVPVTDEQLEDVAGIQSYLNSRLTFGLRQRYDSQVLNGNGTPPNIDGILNRSGIQTQAKAGDPVPDAIHKAMTKVRVTGRAMPNFVVLHPNDWEEIRLLRTDDGIYIWGSPSEAGTPRIWGLPIVQADSLSEGTGLVGDFMFCQAHDRRGVDVQVGYVDAQFGQGKRTIRADFRVAFAVYRAPAFCTVTGI